MRKSRPGQTEEGKVKVKFFWKTSLIISIVLTLLAMIVVNIIF